MSCNNSSFKKKISDAVNGQPERMEAYKRAESPSKPFDLPLVHRTGDPFRGDTVEKIFDSRQLRRPEIQSKGASELKLDPAVYFFYGAGAYPNGRVAFVFHSEIASQADSKFTPFDSGALGAHYHLEPSDYNPNWNDPNVRKDFLVDHTWCCKGLSDFVWDYLHAHFRDIKDYVRLPHYSEPDWPPYHGLKCKEEKSDRRAWTIETRIPAEIPLEKLQAIIIESADADWLYSEVFPEVVDDYTGLVVISRESSNSLEEAVADYIIDKYF